MVHFDPIPPLSISFRFEYDKSFPVVSSALANWKSCAIIS
jgi:hypothetical protein